MRLISPDRSKTVWTGPGSGRTMDHVYSFSLDRFRSSDGLLGPSGALRDTTIEAPRELARCILWGLREEDC